MKMNSRLLLDSISIEDKGYFVLQDVGDDRLIEHPRIRRTIERYNSYFLDIDKFILKDSLSYVSLLELIDSLNRALNKIEAEPITLSPEVTLFIETNKYAINEHQIAGTTIKSFDERWNFELDTFREILDKEMSRPLLAKQIQASFYLATMKRAANFSVPGAGKTAMMYGAFAFLSSPQINKIDKILVICPLNAFEAWRSEFIEVFGNKRTLRLMNLRDARYGDFGRIRLDWGGSNIIVINYESLEPRVNILNELIDSKTMIVFDEVHRVKAVNGRRARAALKIGQNSQYHYVLTGTPIPNSYKDIYNFLHLLYGNEYETFFGWDVKELEQPNPISINEKLKPFFWRTNKDDLKVPKADEDNLIVVAPNNEQSSLVKTIYENESNILALYLRLLQASTNPALLTERINYYDLGFLEDEVELTQFTALNQEEKEQARLQAYQSLNVETIESTKFNQGIKLVLQLVAEDKKVIVWGMFVKTMQKIVNTLRGYGIKVHLIYGGTPKEDRVSLINEFRDGDVEVLVSNPNTLGEAISLHQSVHDAVYFEYNFNLTFMLQSRDRIHRLGLVSDQYTRYYYLMTEGDRSHEGFIDKRVYERLKEKEKIMLEAIDGEMLLPEVTDDFLSDVIKIVMPQKKNHS